MSSHAPTYCLPGARVGVRPLKVWAPSPHTCSGLAIGREPPGSTATNREISGSERGCLNPFPLFLRGRFEEPRLALDPQLVAPTEFESVFQP
jgi:hypothetical protein